MNTGGLGIDVGVIKNLMAQCKQSLISLAKKFEGASKHGAHADVLARERDDKINAIVKEYDDKIAMAGETDEIRSIRADGLRVLRAYDNFRHTLDDLGIKIEEDLKLPEDFLKALGAEETAIQASEPRISITHSSTDGVESLPVETFREYLTIPQEIQLMFADSRNKWMQAKDIISYLNETRGCDFNPQSIRSALYGMKKKNILTHDEKNERYRWSAPAELKDFRQKIMV